MLRVARTTNEWLTSLFTTRCWSLWQRVVIKLLRAAVLHVYATRCKKILRVVVNVIMYTTRIIFYNALYRYCPIKWLHVILRVARTTNEWLLRVAVYANTSTTAFHNTVKHRHPRTNAKMLKTNTNAKNGSLTSRGMPLMSGLQHLGGKQTRAATQWGCERRCVTRVRRWRSWAGGEICENGAGTACPLVNS